MHNKTNSFVIYAEVQLILLKDNASREKNKRNLFLFYSETQLILSKDKASRMHTIDNIKKQILPLTEKVSRSDEGIVNIKLRTNTAKQS